MKYLNRPLQCPFAQFGLAFNLLIVTALSGNAAAVNWIAPSADDYSNPAAWSSGALPGSGDTAVIGNATVASASVLYTNALSTNRLSLLQMNNVAGTSSFTMSDGALLITNATGTALALGNANGGTATFSQSGGTLVVARPSTASQYFQDGFIVGSTANGSGTYNISGGLARILCGVEIGNGNPSTGIFNVSGGTVIANGWFGVGRANNGTGTFNLSSGTLYILRNPNNDGSGNAGGLSLSQGNPANGTANISGGTLYCTMIRFNSVASANQTLNISGGDLYIGYLGLYRQGAAATQTINISGGTFHTANMIPVLAGSTIGDTNTILSDGTNWTWDANLSVNLMDNSFSVNGQSGPGFVTFAPEANRTITLNNVWNGVGGLAMVGPGKLEINGVNGYTGNTTVTGGTIAGSGSIQGNVTVNPGVTLAPGSTFAPGTLGLGSNLNIDSVTNVIKLSSDPFSVGGGVNDLIQVNGNLTLANVSTIKIVPLQPLTPGQPYTVLQYSGTPLTSGDAAHLQVISDSPRYNFTIVDPATTPGSIQITVTGNAANLVWRGGAAGNSTAWDNSSANWLNSAASGLDTFFNGDSVGFDDLANTNLLVLSGPMQASFIGLTNNTVNYTLAGAGPLSGPLDMEGTGSLTLAMSNAPSFSTITANAGTLVFDAQIPGTYSLTAPLTDNGGGQAKIVKTGTNTLVLAADNSFYTGEIIVTNGVLQYTNAVALGAAFAPLYATNGGTLDLAGVISGLKNIIIAGDGFNGAGALINSSGTQLVNGNGVNNLSLAGDATVGSSSRWDSYQNSLHGNGYKLTCVGPGTVLFVDDGETSFGDLHVVAGRLGFQANITMGDPTKTCVVESNATLTFFSLVNAATTNGGADKILVLNGNATLDSGGVANNFNGPVFLRGTNLFGTRSTLHIWNSISDTNGAGGFVLGTDSVGGSGGDLWLHGANTYSGPTIISNRTLFVDAASSLGSSSLIQVNSGAKLDISALPNLQLGAGQALIGNGTVSGNLVFASGGILAAGFPTNHTDTLTVNGDLTFQPGSTNAVKVIKITSVANDKVVGLNSVTFGGTLIVTNLGAPLSNGDAIPLFSAATYNVGAFTTDNITPASPGAGLLWDLSTLGTDGTLRVVSSSGINSNPTNITYSVSGDQMTLEWPQDHTGWTLQAQTNDLTVGISSNWFPVTDSTTTNKIILPIVPSNPTVFYRLILNQ